MAAKNHSRRRVVLLLSSILLLGGCAITSPMPEDHYYRLPAVTVADSLQKPLFKGALLVEPVHSSGILDERSLLYATAAKPDELQRYYYRHWVDTPARMIQIHFGNYLEQRRVAESVLSGNRGQFAAASVGATLLQFERLVAEPEVKVRVVLKLRLASDESKTVLLDKTYHAEVLATDASIYQTVAAYSQALGDIYAAWLEDVASVLQ